MLVNKYNDSLVFKNRKKWSFLFQYFKLIFLFVISQQCDLLTLEKSIQISSDGAIITIEQNASDYLIYYMTQENSSVFAAPISTELDLTYQNGFQINFRNVTLIAGGGNVTLSPNLDVIP